MSTNLWERAKEALRYLVEGPTPVIDGGVAYERALATLSEMERVECVEGNTNGRDFCSGEVMAATRSPAMLLLLPTTEAPE